jgi:hypothetical protein
LAIFGSSFRSVARALLPRAWGWKQPALLIIVPLFAVSCGPSGGGGTTAATATKLVRGPGFSFRAPAGWRVAHTPTSARASAGDASVSAVVYRLGKPYTQDEFAAAATELDRVAAQLAGAAGGSVESSETTTVAGRKVRAYRFGGGSQEHRVAFVLEGKREVQVLCTGPSGGGDPDGACSLLFSSFTLSR